LDHIIGIHNQPQISPARKPSSAGLTTTGQVNTGTRRQQNKAPRRGGTPGHLAQPGLWPVKWPGHPLKIPGCRPGEKRFDPLAITRYFGFVNRRLNLNLLRNALLTGAAVGF
jgi:hypothetical protein